MKHQSLKKAKKITKPDYSKRILFEPSDLPGVGHQLQVVTIPPHTTQRVHWHSTQTEVFFILKGQAILNIANQHFEAKPSDAFVCEPGDTHQLVNETDEPFEILVFKINLPNQDDTTWEE